MAGKRSPAGSAELQLVPGGAVLDPPAHVFMAMLDSWRDQQLARNLATSRVPLLQERGIDLSASQVARLVTGTGASAAGSRSDRPGPLSTSAPESGPPSCARCARPIRLSGKASSTVVQDFPEAVSTRPGPRSLGCGTRRRTTVVAVRRWPNGVICSGCYAQASETYGH